MNQVIFSYEDKIDPLETSLESLLIHRSLAVMDGLGESERMVPVFVCGIPTITNLNEQYRGIQKPTDILSFEGGELNPEGDESAWGELALCLERCEAQAADYGLSLEEELTRLLVHGIIHLTGMDHQTEQDEQAMLELEIKFLDQFGLKDIY